MDWHKAYIKAIEMAAIAHHGATRKFANEPYFVHPLRVSAIVLEHTGSYELACAAVLHDTLEDTSLSAEDISKQFSARIMVLVESVTKNFKLPKSECETEYLTRFRTASNDTIIIKLADRLDNVRDLQNGNVPTHFKSSYARNTVALLDAMPEYALLDPRVARLRKLIAEIIEKQKCEVIVGLGEHKCQCGYPLPCHRH